MHKQLYNLLKFANEQMDLPAPIRVRRLKMPKGFDGDCQKKETYFLIRINKDLSTPAAIDVVLHELAHCLAWNQEEDCHGPKWGHAYSKVYRKFLEWLNV